MSTTVRPIGQNEVLKFIKCQWNFYQNHPNWVPPMIMDRKKLLNTKGNPFFKHAEMQLFLAERDGTVVGRIAAITNENHNKAHNDKVGFFGFFECENSQDTANALFEAASAWLKDRGMDTVRGPVNPSLNDECGLLVDGFDKKPQILMTYNPEYYADLIEKFGFEKAKDLYAFRLDRDKYQSDKLNRLRDAICERYGVTIRNVDFKNKQQYKKDITTLKEIYNTAWQPNWGFVKMTDEEFDYVAADLKPIADPRFVYFVEVEGKVAGFILALPDINQCLIHNKKGGLLGGVYHLLTKRKKIDSVRIVILGVLPEYQRTGVDAVMYHEIGLRIQNTPIVRGEASWILEDNAGMVLALQKAMQTELDKTYRIYDKKIT